MIKNGKQGFYCFNPITLGGFLEHRTPVQLLGVLKANVRMCKSLSYDHAQWQSTGKQGPLNSMFQVVGMQLSVLIS